MGVRSELDKGTAVRVLLPATAQQPAVAESSAETVLESAQKTILLVEDQAVVRELLANVLAESGYSVLTASDGDSALALAGTAVFDLMLTDLMMPRMSGWDLAQRVRALHPRIKVIFMSGSSGEQLVRQQPAGAGVAFLQKPFSMQALSAKVRQMLAKPSGSVRILVIDDEYLG
jgi:CheY-like chemotaxis protein